MSTNQPASVPSPARARPLADEDAGTDDSMTTVLWVGGGALLLLAFLALLCVGFFVFGSFAAGHPLTDIFLTPAP